MLMCFIKAANNNYISLNAQGELVATSAMPTTECHLLVKNLSRPHTENIVPGDQITINSTVHNIDWDIPDFSEYVTGIISDEERRKNNIGRPLPLSSLQYQYQILDPPVLNKNITIGGSLIIDEAVLNEINFITHETAGTALAFVASIKVRISITEITTDSDGSRHYSIITPYITGETRELKVNLILDIASNKFILIPGYQFGSVGVSTAREFLLTRVRLFWVNHKVNLSGNTGNFFSANPDGAVNANVYDPYLWEEFSMFSFFNHSAENLYFNDSIFIRSWLGSYVGITVNSAGIPELKGNLNNPSMFVIESLVGKTGIIQHGDGIRLAFDDFSVLTGLGAGGSWRHPEDAPATDALRYLAINPDGTITTTADVRDVRTRIQVNYYKKLKLAWNENLLDNFSYATVEGSWLSGGGYGFVRTQAYIAIGPRLGCVPLKSYFNEGYTDRYTSATLFAEYRRKEINGYVPFFAPFAIATANIEYVFQRIEGYIFESSNVYTIPLRNYFSAERIDHFLTAVNIDETTAANCNYQYVNVEGHGMDYEKIYKTEFFYQPPINLGNVPLFDAGSGTNIGQFAGRDITNLFPGSPTRQLRALVLSGGGAKGCFEVGAIKRLWDEGYRPDIICGVSVGSVNAIKLAENKAESADDLIKLWRRFSSKPGKVFRENHYINVFKQLLQRALGAAADTAIATGIGALIGMFLAGPVGIAAGGAIGFFSGQDLSRLDAKTIRLMNAVLTMMHSQHSMEPLRQRLREELSFDRLYESSANVKLRLGITDLKHGQFLTVSGPNADLGSANAHLGLVEVEPDHQLGDNWLTKPLLGTSGYTMDLRDAVYASSALPVFMEPLVFNFNHLNKVVDSFGKSYTHLEASLPKGLKELLEITKVLSESGADYLQTQDENLWRSIDAGLDEIITRNFQFGDAFFNKMNDYAKDGIRGFESTSAILYDGGLRDTLPIRTAMRLGATEITCITGDQFQKFEYGFSSPARLDANRITNIFGLFNSGNFSNINIGNTPAAKHFLGLLGIWFNDVARNDMLMAIGENEYLGWLRKAFLLLPEADKNRLLGEIDQYIQTTGSTRYEALGATGLLGGNLNERQPYGMLGIKESSTIRYIAPDRELLGPLEFENYVAIEEGMHLGYERAKSPLIVSK